MPFWFGVVCFVTCDLRIPHWYALPGSFMSPVVGISLSTDTYTEKPFPGEPLAHGGISQTSKALTAFPHLPEPPGSTCPRPAMPVLQNPAQSLAGSSEKETFRWMEQGQEDTWLGECKLQENKDFARYKICLPCA